MKNQDNEKAEEEFRGLNNQYVWLSHAHEKLYLNVKEVYSRDIDRK